MGAMTATPSVPRCKARRARIDAAATLETRSEAALCRNARRHARQAVLALQCLLLLSALKFAFIGRQAARGTISLFALLALPRLQVAQLLLLARLQLSELLAIELAAFCAFAALLRLKFADLLPFPGYHVPRFRSAGRPCLSWKLSASLLHALARLLGTLLLLRIGLLNFALKAGLLAGSGRLWCDGARCLSRRSGPLLRRSGTMPFRLILRTRGTGESSCDNEGNCGTNDELNHYSLPMQVCPTALTRSPALCSRGRATWKNFGFIPLCHESQVRTS
jgi:hypothetical protein